MRLLNSKKSAISNTILIEEAPVKSGECYMKLLKILLEKLDGLNGELEHLDSSLRVEIPWRRINSKKKCQIINHIKSNRLYKSMNLTIDHHEDQKFDKESNNNCEN